MVNFALKSRALSFLPPFRPEMLSARFSYAADLLSRCYMLRGILFCSWRQNHSLYSTGRATLCAPRCRDKLLLVYRRIFVKIFRLRNRILSPQQFAQIQSDFVYPNPQTRWLCRMEVQVCVRLPPPGYPSASTINEWNELLEFK